ncbi:MAG: OmpH family outer membrane protein [Verrucomicrobiota bacterium]
MKTPFRTLCIALSAFVATAACAQDFDMATVDMERVFDTYYKTTRADKTLKEQEKAYEEHAKTLAKEIDAARRKREEMQEKALNVALSQTVRQNCRKEAKKHEETYQEKRGELRKFMETKRGELQKEYMEKRKSIVKEITDFIESHAQERGFDFVFDASGFTSNMIPVVIYASPDTDITESIMAELNRGHEDELKAAEEDE